jgi:hypothetical protein
MNFAALVGSSLRSGYALPTQRPDHGLLRNQPAGDPPIEAETLSRPSRPPLSWLFGPGWRADVEHPRPRLLVCAHCGPSRLRAHQPIHLAAVATGRHVTAEERMANSVRILGGSNLSGEGPFSCPSVAINVRTSWMIAIPVAINLGPVVVISRRCGIPSCN